MCRLFAAEHNKDEVLEGKFRNLNFSPFTKKTTEYCLELRTIVLLNNLKLSKKPLFKSDVGHVISRQEKHQLPKSTARFPAKKRWHSPTHVRVPGTPLPFPQSMYWRAYTEVRTKIARINRLPNFLIHGAPLCGLRVQRVRRLINNCIMQICLFSFYPHFLHTVVFSPYFLS